jgi:hypothetical protein
MKAQLLFQMAKVIQETLSDGCRHHAAGLLGADYRFKKSHGLI